MCFSWPLKNEDFSSYSRKFSRRLQYPTISCNPSHNKLKPSLIRLSVGWFITNKTELNLRSSEVGKYNKNLKIRWKLSLLPSLLSKTKTLLKFVKNYVKVKFFYLFTETSDFKIFIQNTLSNIICKNKSLVIARSSVRQTFIFWHFS